MFRNCFNKANGCRCSGNFAGPFTARVDCFGSRPSTCDCQENNSCCCNKQNECCQCEKTEEPCFYITEQQLCCQQNQCFVQPIPFCQPSCGSNKIYACYPVTACKEKCCESQKCCCNSNENNCYCKNACNNDNCNKSDCGCITVNVISCDTALVTPNVEVTILDANDIVVAAGLTDASGNFTASCINLGTYTINAYNSTTSNTATTTVTLTCANRDVETQICLNNPITGSITLTVTNCVNASALPNVRVRLYDHNFSLVDEQRTDLNGKYFKDQLTEGAYFLEMFHEDTQQTKFKQVTINSTTTDPSVTECFIVETGEISLRVTVCDTTTPIANAQVRLLDENRNVVDSGVTDANGLYDKTNLPFGEYFLDVIDTVSSEAKENEVIISRGRPTDFVQNCFSRCVNQTINITGHVTDSCGCPISGAIIVVRANTTRQARTDAAGNYTITGVTACDGFTITAMHCNRSKRVIFNNVIKQNYSINFIL